MWWRFAMLTIIAVAGCGPSARELQEQTLSVLSTEADRWDGGQEFKTTATDAYGRPFTVHIEKRILHNTLELRSAGPDGLPKNSDDIVVHRRKRHGESSLTEEAAKATEQLTESALSGTLKGVKKGLGLSGGDKRDK
jgi:hypothetical protein